jgi:hypothetical protein
MTTRVERMALAAYVKEVKVKLLSVEKVPVTVVESVEMTDEKLGTKINYLV